MLSILNSLGRMVPVVLPCSCLFGAASWVRKTQLARQAGSLADQAAFSAFWLTTFVAIEVSAMSVACSSSSVV